MKAQSAILKWRDDPVLFAEQVLGIKPYPVKKGYGLEAYQVEILRALAADPRAHVCVKSCHCAGKTFLDAVIAIWFLWAWGPSKVITTAPVWRQVENIAWPQIRSLIKQAPYPLIDPEHGHNDTPLQQTQIKLDDEWFAIGVSTNRPEDFEGWHADNLLFILDSSGSMTGEVSTQPPYDSSVVYSGSCESDKYYWTTGSSIPTCGDQYKIDKTAFLCQQGLTQIADAGSYTDTMAMYRQNWKGVWKWRTPSKSQTDKAVECEADSGVL